MQINKDRLLQEFMELVQIDSESKEEYELAQVLKGKLEELGFAVQMDDAGEKIGGNSGNLIATKKGNKEQVPLLFCAHMDRVSPGKNIKPQIRDGILYSDGSTILAADDIAGVTAILEGVRTIKEAGTLHGDLEVVFTVAEEGGIFGAKNLDTQSLQSKMGYFLDSGGPVGTIVNQAPSQIGLEFVFHGKAAHAGLNPEAGINAIVVASQAISAMKLGRIDEETTANIGIIQGGVATNIVTDLVTVKGEARSLVPEKLTLQADHMVQVAEEAAKKNQAQVEIRREISYPAFTIKEEEPIVQLACGAISSMGLTPHVMKTGGGSDANVFNDRGIPSILLGMGYKNVHSKNESIPISQLEQSALLVATLISLAPVRP